MDAHAAEDTTIKFQLDKNKLTVSQDLMHHGFWGLSLERGALPNEYRGRYTKKSEALKAAQIYMESRASKE